MTIPDQIAHERTVLINLNQRLTVEGKKYTAIWWLNWIALAASIALTGYLLADRLIAEEQRIAWEDRV